MWSFLLAEVQLFLLLVAICMSSAYGKVPVPDLSLAASTLPGKVNPLLPPPSKKPYLPPPPPNTPVAPPAKNPFLPPSPPTKAPPTPPPKAASPPVTPPIKSSKECIPLCGDRCKAHSRIKVCTRACRTCCDRCKCVPPGTNGNREMCGKCYTDMTTHGGKFKCP